MTSLIPLAERMRPHSLLEYVGQTHLVGENGSLTRSLDIGVLPSMILWGPPGVGKTTLANLLANQTKRQIHVLSAISSGVKDIRDVIAKAEQSNMFETKGAILFIDEIHRFSKSQQDSLLGAVERGTVTLIGATTENPSFEVISALLSRCQVYVLESLTKDELTSILEKAILEDKVLKQKKIELVETKLLLALSGGDARKLLNNFELVVNSIAPDKNGVIRIDDAQVKLLTGSKLMSHDKDGEDHYDLASAFIKSIRGSDPNAAIYWLARLIEGGEEPTFIARRLLISASEDIGLANPNALLIANTAFDAVKNIGFPESRIILAQCTIYLASSPKGNAAYKAINEAQAFVQKTGKLPIPLHLRNAPTGLMKELGYGKEYQYPHDFEANFTYQEYMPEEAGKQNFFFAGSSPKEQEVTLQIIKFWNDKYKAE
jgi:putative ATPase